MKLLTTLAGLSALFVVGCSSEPVPSGGGNSAAEVNANAQAALTLDKTP